jgi:sugar/nucleoside kinase (ribokinase family)
MKTKKIYNLCGVGHAIVDILVDCQNSFLAKHNLQKGTMCLVNSKDQQTLLKSLGEQVSPRMVSGGSVANSIIAFAALGGKTSLICSMADDRYGLFYRTEMEQLGVSLTNLLRVGDVSGTSLILVTPDSERTMRTCLAAGAKVDIGAEEERLIAESEWLFIEGYLLSNPTHGLKAIENVMRVAKEHQTKIAFTCSEEFIVRGFPKQTAEIIEASSLIFANEAEAQAVTGKVGAEAAFYELSHRCPGVVVTASERGAFLSYNGKREKIEAVQTKLVDLTGAGDMFAAAILYGIISGASLKKSGNAAAALASRVISQFGARLHGGIVRRII